MYFRSGFKIKKKLNIDFVCVHICEGRKRVSDLLDLELEAFVNAGLNGYQDLNAGPHQ